MVFSLRSLIFLTQDQGSPQRRHQGNHKDRASGEEENAGYETEDIVVPDARNDKEQSAYHEKNPPPEVEFQFSVSIVVWHFTQSGGP
jgi:hypothetical protein